MLMRHLHSKRAGDDTDKVEEKLWLIGGSLVSGNCAGAVALPTVIAEGRFGVMLPWLFQTCPTQLCLCFSGACGIILEMLI